MVGYSIGDIIWINDYDYWFVIKNGVFGEYI